MQEYPEFQHDLAGAQGELREADGSSPKACFTVQVVLPESNKSIVKAKFESCLLARVKFFSHFSVSIVLGEVILGHQAELEFSATAFRMAARDGQQDPGRRIDE